MASTTLLQPKQCSAESLLRWCDTLKYEDFHEKSFFLKIEDLRPLNTCQKHFEVFPLDHVTGDDLSNRRAMN